MANELLYYLRTPIQSERRQREKGWPESAVAVEATDDATADPDSDSPYIDTGAIDTVRLLVTYTGTVTSAKLRVWLLQDGVWYRAGGATLNPGSGNEAYDATGVGANTRFAVQVEEITGGGTIEVRVLGVR